VRICGGQASDKKGSFGCLFYWRGVSLVIVSDIAGFALSIVSILWHVSGGFVDAVQSK